jgi:deoxyribose-phosphate aldolase
MNNPEENKVLAQHIEHTLLKPDCTTEDITLLCQQALEQNFVAVCVPPYFVQLAKKILNNSPVKIVTVVGFPFGYNTVSSKVEEVKKAINSGANEIDMVMNIAALKSKDISTLQNDIQSVVTACQLQNRICKVIIETGNLTEDELKLACKICVDCEADYVKTSTGYGLSGASLETVELMRKILPTRVKIKASGGIKNRKFAQELIQAGANRIGTSSGMAILEEEI